MNNLIEALQIFAKYTKGECKFPTHCEHDILMISPKVVTPGDLSDEDEARVEELGFFVSEEYGCYASFRYGSA